MVNFLGWKITYFLILYFASFFNPCIVQLANMSSFCWLLAFQGLVFSASHFCADWLPMIGARLPSGLNHWSLLTAGVPKLGRAKREWWTGCCCSMQVEKDSNVWPVPAAWARWARTRLRTLHLVLQTLDRWEASNSRMTIMRKSSNKGSRNSSENNRHVFSVSFDVTTCRQFASVARCNKVSNSFETKNFPSLIAFVFNAMKFLSLFFLSPSSFLWDHNKIESTDYGECYRWQVKSNWIVVWRFSW